MEGGAKPLKLKEECTIWAEAFARTKNVENPRTSRFLELFFHDEDGKYVIDERIGVPSRPLYPWDDPKTVDGWSRFSGIYRAPMKATHATLLMSSLGT